jgi:hypothetical protein
MEVKNKFRNLFILSPSYTDTTKIENFKLLNWNQNGQSDLIIGRKSGYFIPHSTLHFATQEVGILYYDGNEYYSVFTNNDSVNIQEAQRVMANIPVVLP